MAEVILNKISVLKQDLFSTFKSLLVGAGWSNISSNPSTDFDVFYSTGVTGNKNLYFQIRSTDINGSNDTNTTAGAYWSCRLINKYTPGQNNSAGTFDRAENWRYVLLFNGTTIPLDAYVNVYYHVNKNRIIFLTEAPNVFSHYGNVFLLGMPDGAFVDEVDSRGVVFAPNINYSVPGANNLLATSSSHIQRTSLNQSIYSTVIPLGINSSKKFMFSQLAYGDNTEGVRGILDGVYTSSAGPFQNGDTFTEGVKVYKVFYQETPSSWASGYGSKYVVIRIQ